MDSHRLLSVSDRIKCGGSKDEPLEDRRSRWRLGKFCYGSTFKSSYESLETDRPICIKLGIFLLPVLSSD